MQVYKITNDINDKVYIGATKLDLPTRLLKHFEKVNVRPHNKFYLDIKKYGREHFKIEGIVTTSSWEELYKLEAYYIKQYNSVKCGYNTLSSAPTIDDWEEFYDIHKKAMNKECIRNKISTTMKQRVKDGKLFTEQHRDRLSKSAVGNSNGVGNPSHSIACYCIDNILGKIVFKNYKEAGLWWYNTYHPFGDVYSQATYQRKIIDCIESGCCKYRHPNTHKYITINKDNIQWFRVESEVM